MLNSILLATEISASFIQGFSRMSDVKETITVLQHHSERETTKRENSVFLSGSLVLCSV